MTLHNQFSIELIDAVRPEGGMSMARAIDVLTYLIEGRSIRGRRAREAHVARAKAALVPFNGLFTSSADVTYALAVAVLGRRGEQVRRALNLTVLSKIRVTAPHYRNRADWSASWLDRLLSTTGTLSARLNTVHTYATDLRGLRLRLSYGDRPVSVDAEYGVGGSTWFHTVTVLRAGEPIEAMLDRALSLTDAMLRAPTLVDCNPNTGRFDVLTSATATTFGSMEDRGHWYMKHRSLVSSHATRAEAEDALLALVPEKGLSCT